MSQRVESWKRRLPNHDNSIVGVLGFRMEDHAGELCIKQFLGVRVDARYLK